MIDQLRAAEKLRKEGLRYRKAASAAHAAGDPARAAEFEAASTTFSAATDKVMSNVPACPIVAGEVVPTEAERPDDQGGWAIRNTLASPDAAAIAASLERTDLLQQPHVDVLALAIDAAQSVGGNPIETMLVHEMALAHETSFRLIDRAMGERDTVEMARLINAAARMMSVYQQGLLALHRIRTGGTQNVVVQHIAVSGGQAVVTGNVQTGGPATVEEGADR